MALLPNGLWTDWKDKRKELSDVYEAHRTSSNDITDVAPQFSCLVHEVVNSALEATDDRCCEKLAEFFQERKMDEESQGVLLDVIWLQWLQVASSPDSLPLRSRVVAFTKDLLKQEVLSAEMAAARLQNDFCREIGLVGDAAKLKKRMLQYTTKQRYRQHKFNLLREENEGYAKLITDLFEFFPSGSSTKSASPNSNAKAMTANAMSERMKSLIGVFDLDPNRVADIVLEVYEATIRRTRCKAFPMLGEFLLLLEHFKSSSLASLLGFKFQYYARPEVTAREYTPISLFYLAAALVRARRVSVDQLYPHLYPSDELAAKQCEERGRQGFKEAKAVNAHNLNADPKAVAKRAESARLAKVAGQEEGKAKAKAAGVCGYGYGPPNQKEELVAALLFVDAWDDARPLLQKMKHLNPTENDRVSRALCGFLKRTIAPLYKNTLAKYNVLGDAAAAAKSNAKAKLGSGNVDMEVKADTDALTLENAPARLLEPLLFLNVYLHRDVVLYTKVCRILREHLRAARAVWREQIEEYKKKRVQAALRASSATDEADNAMEIDAVDEKEPPGEMKVDDTVLRILEEVLLPAFSCLTANCGISREMWGVLCLLPYQTRYSLYGHWDEVTYTKFPTAALAKAHAVKATKEFSKRVANTRTVLREWSRKIIKFSLANPLPVLRVMLKNAQRFGNMIPALIDSMRFLTDLSFDVVTFLLLQELSSTRSKLKNDGVNLEDWFSHLCDFAGQYYRKYPDLPLEPLLAFVVNSLKSETSLALLVVKDLIRHMAGVEVFEEMPDDLLEGQSGGTELQTQTATWRQTKNKRRSTAALLSALQKNNLIMPLFALIAQQKNFILYRTDTTQVELIAELYDKCQGILIQFHDFISTQMHADRDNYAAMFPPLTELVREFNLTPEAAFYILRPVILDPRICGTVPSTTRPSEDQEVKEADSPKKPSNPLAKAAMQLLPAETWTRISPEFYSVFWSLSMYDLYVPKTQYSNLLRKLHDQAAALKSQIAGAAHSSSSEEVAANGKRKRELEKLEKAISRLKNERTLQMKNRDSVMQRLREEKDTWLVDVPDKKALMTEFLQSCVLPRCFATPLDALYCAKFIEVVVELETPFFNLPHVTDQLFKSLGSVVNSCTANEASRYGRFLKEILSKLHIWRGDQKKFNKDCRSNPSFAPEFGARKTTGFSHNMFLKVLKKWHRRLFDTFQRTLLGKNKMTKRNSLLILKNIASEFPKISSVGNALSKILKDIGGDDKLKGSTLQLLARATSNVFEVQQINWMSEATFAPGIEPRGRGMKKQKTTSANKTPTKLNPNAQPFTPTSTPTKAESKSSSSNDKRGTKRSREREARARDSSKKVKMSEESKTKGDASTSRESRSGSTHRKRGHEAKEPERSKKRKVEEDKRTRSGSRRRSADRSASRSRSRSRSRSKYKSAHRSSSSRRSHDRKAAHTHSKHSRSPARSARRSGSKEHSRGGASSRRSRSRSPKASRSTRKARSTSPHTKHTRRSAETRPSKSSGDARSKRRDKDKDKEKSKEKEKEKEKGNRDRDREKDRHRDSKQRGQKSKDSARKKVRPQSPETKDNDEEEEQRRKEQELRNKIMVKRRVKDREKDAPARRTTEKSKDDKSKDELPTPDAPARRKMIRLTSSSAKDDSSKETKDDSARSSKRSKVKVKMRKHDDAEESEAPARSRKVSKRQKKDKDKDKDTSDKAKEDDDAQPTKRGRKKRVTKKSDTSRRRSKRR